MAPGSAGDWGRQVGCGAAAGRGMAVQAAGCVGEHRHTPDSWGELTSGGNCFLHLSNLIRSSSSLHTDKSHCWQENGDTGRAPQETCSCLRLQGVSESTVTTGGQWKQHCTWCEQVEDLKEELKRLRVIRECEGEIDWWSCTLPSRREMHCMKAQQESQ